MTSEPLSKLLTPKANDKITQQLRKDLQKISDQDDFRTSKNRIGLFKCLAPRLKLDEQKSQQILEAVLKGEAEQAKADVKANNWVGSKQDNVMPSWNPTTWRIWKTFSGEDDVEGGVDNLIRGATEAATKISDSQFLSQLKQDVEQYTQRIPEFKERAEQARHKALEHLRVRIMETVENFNPETRRLQEEECTAWINRESAKRAEEELDKLRVNLIKHVNDLSMQTACPCVSSPFLLVDCDLKLTLLFVDIRCPYIACGRVLERSGPLVSGDLIDMIRGQHSAPCRPEFFDVVSDLGFANLASRPNGNIHSASDGTDDTRSPRVATEPECDPFTTIQVQSNVHIAIGPFRGVRLCFLRLAYVT